MSEINHNQVENLTGCDLTGYLGVVYESCVVKTRLNAFAKSFAIFRFYGCQRTIVNHNVVDCLTNQSTESADVAFVKGAQ